MLKLAILFERILRWLGLWIGPGVFDDHAHADIRPKDYDAQLHRFVSILRASLLGVRRDCVFVDVSRWQGLIDFEKMRKAGVKAVIIKCGQGLGLDANFVRNWAAAKKAGLLRGTYWYFDSRVDPKVQAKLWADALIANGAGELPHFGDYEENYGGTYRGIVNFQSFLLEFQNLSLMGSNYVGVYTGYFYWNAHGSTDQFWNRYWLWIAWYGEEADVVLPKPWTQEHLFGWQYTDHGDGIALGVSSKELDMNFFTKGLSVFEVLYGEAPEPEEPSTGESGMFRVVSTVFNMSLRSEPTINSSRVQSWLKGTIFTCDRIDVPPISGGIIGDKWAHVVSVGGQTCNLWVAQVHDGVKYCDAEPIGAQVPTATIIFTDQNGVTWKAENVQLIVQ